MTLAERITRMEAQLAEMNALLGEFVARRPSPPPVEHPDDLVTVVEIAALFRCAPASVLKGKAGTKGIEFVPRRRPKMARRGQVMQVYRNYVASKKKGSPRRRTIKLLNRQGAKRRAA